MEKQLTRASEGMAGLAKGLAILEAFGPERTQLTIADAAEEAGITRAAARRCLLTLTDLGYLAHDGKWFRPLPRLLRLGFSYLRSDPLTQLAQAILASVRDEVGESVSLAVLDGDDAVFVARSTVSRIVSRAVTVGARLPAFCSATGRVLLAALPDDEIEAYLERVSLKPRTPQTVIDADELLTTIRQVRVNGYGISDEELEPGLRAIAVPVRDKTGHLVAAMSVSTAATRMDTDVMLSTLLPALRRGANALGNMMAQEIQ